MALFEFDASGKAKLPTQDEYEQMDRDGGIIALSQGTQDDGQPYFAYIAVKPSKYAEFASMAEQETPCVLEDYGDVIFFDSLSEPPELVVQYMRAVYGFDEELQEKVFEEFRKEQREYIGKIEEKRALNIVAMMKKQNPSGNA